MSRFWRVLRLILLQLQPFLVILSIILAFSVTLFIYDLIKTSRERRLGAALAENLDIKSSCITNLVGQNENFDFSFTFNNKNSQSVFIEKVGVDLNLLGAKDKKFSSLISTTPNSVFQKLERGFYFYQFDPAIEIAPKEKREVVLKLRTSTKKHAKANPNTIVIYSGNIVFYLSPEITNIADCSIQIRYSN